MTGAGVGWLFQLSRFSSAEQAICCHASEVGSCLRPVMVLAQDQISYTY